MKSIFLPLMGLTLLLGACEKRREASPGPTPELQRHLESLRTAIDPRFPHLVSRGLLAEMHRQPVEQLPAMLTALLSKNAATVIDAALLEHLLVRLTTQNPEVAAEWMLAHSQSSRWQAAAFAALPILAIKAPQTVPTVAGKLPQVATRQLAWRCLAEVNPSFALDALRQQTQPDPELPDDDAWRDLIHHASRVRPKEVADWMIRQPDARELLDKWRFAVLSNWTLRDAPAALDWMLAPANRPHLSLDEWLKDVSNVPVFRVDWMQAMIPVMPASVHRGRLVAKTAHILAQKSPETARQWSAALSSSADQEAARRGLMEAAQEGLPNDLILPAADDGIVRYVEARTALGFEATFAWAAKLDAVGLRHRALHAAARFWATKDRAAAEAAVAALTNESDRRAATVGMKGFVTHR